MIKVPYLWLMPTAWADRFPGVERTTIYKIEKIRASIGNPGKTTWVISCYVGFPDESTAPESYEIDMGNHIPVFVRRQMLKDGIRKQIRENKEYQSLEQ